MKNIQSVLFIFLLFTTACKKTDNSADDNFAELIRGEWRILDGELCAKGWSFGESGVFNVLNYDDCLSSFEPCTEATSEGTYVINGTEISVTTDILIYNGTIITLTEEELVVSQNSEELMFEDYNCN